jgi:hypothetical protein
MVLFGDDEVKVNIPKKILPKGAKEGSWLKVSIDLDKEGTMKQEEKIRAKLDKQKINKSLCF